MYLLGIDPSINHLGWVLFKYENTVNLGCPPPQLAHCGTLRTVKFKDYDMADRIVYTIEELERTLKGVLPHPFHFQIVVIEEPQLWGAFKSMASQHAGSLLSLYMLTGALCWWGCAYTEELASVPVSKWKGQLPKRITKARMEKRWGCTFRTDDESDAAGLGTYYLQEKGYLPR